MDRYNVTVKRKGHSQSVPVSVPFVEPRFWRRGDNESHAQFGERLERAIVEIDSAIGKYRRKRRIDDDNNLVNADEDGTTFAGSGFWAACENGIYLAANNIAVKNTLPKTPGDLTDAEREQWDDLVITMADRTMARQALAEMRAAATAAERREVFTDYMTDAANVDANG
jgi:hypothetical protein